MWEEQREMWVEEHLWRKAMLGSLSVLRRIMQRSSEGSGTGAQDVEGSGAAAARENVVVEAAAVLMVVNDLGMLHGRVPEDDRMEEDDAMDSEGEEQAGNSSEV
jgi:hypothetical protein